MKVQKICLIKNEKHCVFLLMINKNIYETSRLNLIEILLIHSQDFEAFSTTEDPFKEIKSTGEYLSFEILA